MLEPSERVLKQTALAVLFTVCLTCWSCWGQHAEVSKAAPDPRAARIKAVLGVTPPCSLAWCMDLGSVRGVAGLILGIAGDSLKFAYQSPPMPQMHTGHDMAKHRALIESLKVRLHFPVAIGTIDRRGQGGRLLPSGSPDESLFIFVLRTAHRPTEPRLVIDASGTHAQGEMADIVANVLEERRSQVALEERSKDSLKVR